MSKLTESNVAWNSSKLSSARPPGDGEEQLQSNLSELSRGKSYDNMGLKTEDPNASSCAKDSSASSTIPPYVRWAEGLHHLLSDKVGIDLFMQFLMHEGYGRHSLEFWLACEGIYRKGPPVPKDLFRTLYQVYVTSLHEIQQQTKREISEKIKSGTGLDCHIFDTARKEVEEAIMTTTYPNFLQSDLYIAYMQAVDAENALRESTEYEALQVIEKASQAMEKCAAEESADMKIGNSSRNNLALDNNESQDELLPTLYEDREFEANTANSKKPLTREFLQKRFAVYSRKARPEAEAGHYLKANTPGYDTAYHVKYSSCLPPSAQDSELQSLSSDALTDDSKSLKDYSPEVRNKGYMKKSDRYFRPSKHDMPLNKDSFPNFPVSGKVQKQQGKRPNMSDEEFTKRLKERLEEVQRQQQLDEYLHEPQAILDAHVSRVIRSWTGSALQTPGSLTPPTLQPPNDSSCRQRAALSSQPYASNYNQHAKPHQNEHYLRHHDNVQHQREMEDTYSCDSGTVRDYTLDIASSAREQNREHDYMSEDPMSSAEVRRRFKEQAKRCVKNDSKISTWESRSSFDSGMSSNFQPSGTETTPQKFSNWYSKYGQSDACESERESLHHKASSPSLSPIRGPSFGKKSSASSNSANSNTFPNSSRAPWNLSSQQAGGLIESTVVCHHSYAIAMPISKTPLAHDQHLPPMLPGSSNADATLDECTRRLESNLYCKPKSSRSMSAGRDRSVYDAMKSKQSFAKGFESQDDGTLHNRKAGRKSCPLTIQNTFMPTAHVAAEPPKPIAIAYCFGNGTVPFLCKLHGKNITLKQFKSLISKKGNFRYFFKKNSEDFGIVLEEVTEDNEVLPLYEGKIFSVIETVDESR